ncbi:hypothetical protein FA15DRAFT_693776 [Coprinopsis marcescibilis]|uniref:Uncharacterized protein n=1 Tax=Coprinopsis marcescibilis TaxID=230819 RepID=A0A5C3KXX1_COPMA|nr:hypothetical protein FA15DRAFT_693776 [Coprinopsis marcescibilis]
MFPSGTMDFLRRTAFRQCTSRVYVPNGRILGWKRDVYLHIAAIYGGPLTGGYCEAWTRWRLVEAVKCVLTGKPGKPQKSGAPMEWWTDPEVEEAQEAFVTKRDDDDIDDIMTDKTEGNQSKVSPALARCDRLWHPNVRSWVEDMRLATKEAFKSFLGLLLTCGHKDWHRADTLANDEIGGGWTVGYGGGFRLRVLTSESRKRVLPAIPL